MNIIHGLLQLYIYIIIADIVLSYIPQAQGHAVGQWIRKIADVTLKPVRDLFPRDIPLDPSPMIVIIVIQMLMYLL